MGDVIAFQAGAKIARRALPPAGDAQILFFLGVRYMRLDDPPPPTAHAPNARGGETAGGKKRRRRARA